MSTIDARTAARSRISVESAAPRPGQIAATVALAAIAAPGPAASTTVAEPRRPQAPASLAVLETEELLREGARPPEMLLDPLLPAGSVMLVHGPAGVGLSQFLIGCAVALATGGAFIRGRAPRPVRTALLVGCLPTGIVARRIACTIAGASGEAGDRLITISIDEQRGGSPDLGRLPDMGALWQAIGPAEVLLIDDFSDLLPSFHRSAAAQAAHVSRMLFAFRARGLTVVAGVHSGRKGEFSRVDRAVFASVDRVADIVVALRRPRERIDYDNVYCELEIERAAHLSYRERVARLHMLASAAVLSAVPPDTAGVDPRKAAAIELMANGLDAESAAVQAGVSRASAYRWRRQLLARSHDLRESVRFAGSAAAGDVAGVPQRVESDCFSGQT